VRRSEDMVDRRLVFNRCNVLNGRSSEAVVIGSVTSIVRKL